MRPAHPPPFLAHPLPWQAPTCPPSLRHPDGPAGWCVGALLVDGEVGGGGSGGGTAPGGSSRRALILRCRDGWGGESGQAFAVKACMCGGAGEWREEVSKARQEAAAHAAVAAAAPPGAALPLYAAFEDEGGVYLAMPLAGPSARVAARTAGGFLSEASIARLAQAGAAALGAAHAAGWAHGDVKPENFLSLVVARHKGGVPAAQLRFALADWGSATRLGECVPGAAGTLDYTPPERVAAIARGLSMVVGGGGERTPPLFPPPLSSPAADVWALGVTVAELLTGAPPFERESAEATLHAISSSSSSTAPPWLPPHLSPGARAWVGAALAPDPRARPAAAALAARPWGGWCVDNGGDGDETRD